MAVLTWKLPPVVEAIKYLCVKPMLFQMQSVLSSEYSAAGVTTFSSPEDKDCAVYREILMSVQYTTRVPSGEISQPLKASKAERYHSSTCLSTASPDL